MGVPARLTIAVLGTGPRAVASAICLSRHHRVALAEKTSHGIPRSFDRPSRCQGEPELEELLRRTGSNIELTDSFAGALNQSDLVIVAEQPRFVRSHRTYDMSAIEHCIGSVARHRPRATVILESPTPVGFAIMASMQYRVHVIPAPLHLKQGRIARDRVQPSRILVGDASDRGLAYAFVAVRSCRDLNTPYFLAHPSEVEAIHAFERRRVLRGRSETQDEVSRYCRLHRLNEVQVLQGLQPVECVQEA